MAQFADRRRSVISIHVQTLILGSKPVNVVNFSQFQAIPSYLSCIDLASMVSRHGQCLILCLAGAAAVRTGLHDAHATTGEDPERVDFGPGEKPVKKYLQIFDRNGGADGGVYVTNAVPDNENASYSESKSGILAAIQGEGEKPTKIGARTTRQWVERVWARQIHSNKPYHLSFARSSYMSESEYHRFLLMRLAIVTVATFLSLLVAICLFPCFVVGLCCKFALSSETEESENTEPPQQPKSDEVPATDNGRPIPRLKQSWFTYIVRAKITQVSLVLFSMSQLLNASIEIYQMKQSVMEEPVFAMLDIGIPVAQLALCVSVVMGVRAAKTCQIVAEGATAPEDLLDTMHTELRWSVLLPFVPQAFIQVLISGFMTCLFVSSFLRFMCEFFESCHGMWMVYDFNMDKVWGVMHMFGIFRFWQLLDIVCHQTLFQLMLLFMLDAYIAARVVTSHVNVISNRLKGPLNFEQLKEVHISCVQLVKGPLKDLSVISQPTFAIALLNWLYAFLVAFQTLLYGGSVCHLVAILVSHIPIGLSCLLLPATVSDACTQVTRHLNEQRSDPNQDDVHRQVNVTEKFINGVNDGQGLGFVLYGTGMVVNKRAIFTGAAKIVGIASIVIPAASEFCSQQRTSHALLFGK